MDSWWLASLLNNYHHINLQNFSSKSRTQGHNTRSVVENNTLWQKRGSVCLLQLYGSVQAVTSDLRVGPEAHYSFVVPVQGLQPIPALARVCSCPRTRKQVNIIHLTSVCIQRNTLENKTMSFLNPVFCLTGVERGGGGRAVSKKSVHHYMFI